MTVTEKCDVYSFGVVALEIVMGKHPGELISSLSKPSSTQCMMLKDVLDSRLRSPLCRREARDVVLVVTLALSCLHPMPKLRPSMQQVAQHLLVSNRSLLFPFHEMSIFQLLNQEMYVVDNNINKC